MAARRFFSGMSRLTGLLGADASAARAAAAPAFPEGVFHGTAVHPGMKASSNAAIHGYAPRYFNVFPCSHSDAKTSLTTIGMTSTTMNGMKTAFLDFARVKRTFSSSASRSNNQNSAMETKIAAWQAQDAACKPKLSVAESIKKDVDTTIALMVFTSLCVIYMSAVENTSENTSRNGGSSHCLNCCNCPCHGSNPKVQ